LGSTNPLEFQNFNSGFTEMEGAVKELPLGKLAHFDYQIADIILLSKD